MGGKPENVESVGDVEKATKVFVRNELTLLQERASRVLMTELALRSFDLKNTSSTTTTSYCLKALSCFITTQFLFQCGLKLAELLDEVKIMSM